MGWISQVQGKAPNLGVWGLERPPDREKPMVALLKANGCPLQPIKHSSSQSGQWANESGSGPRGALRY